MRLVAEDGVAEHAAEQGADDADRDRRQDSRSVAGRA